MKTTRDWFYSEWKNKHYSGVRIWRARDEGKIVQWDKNGNGVGIAVQTCMKYLENIHI